MAKERSKKKEESSPEYIQVKVNVPRPYRWSTGKYLGKVYKEAKYSKKMVGNRCPKCKEILWPPVAVCGRCKIEAGEDWVELPQKGTVIQYTYLVLPMWDPHYGERWANPYPSATIELDDCGVYHRAWLEETDKDKLKVGMRVEAVWKEREEERGEGMGDILYFRAIEEQEDKK